MLPQVSVYCSCKEKSNQNSDDNYILDILKDPNNNFPITNMMFCRKCSSVRCPRCVEPEFVASYCPHCLTFSKGDSNYCGRNCFVCPICESNISITAQSAAVEGSKSFTFRCSNTNCYYKYNSGILNKPKSLSRFIRSKIASSKYYHHFSELQKNHILRTSTNPQKRNLNKPTRNKNPDFRKMLEDLQNKQLTIKNSKNESEIIMEFSEEQDIDDSLVLSSLISDATIIDYETYLKSQVQYTFPTVESSRLFKKIDKNNKAEFQETLPIPRKLKARKILKCVVCRENLVQPLLPESFTNVNSNNAFKFSKTSDAIDMLPWIRAKQISKDGELYPGSAGSLILTFKNPLVRNRMKIMVSTFDSSHSDQGVEVNLPCQNFTVGKLETLLNKNSNTVNFEDENDEATDNEMAKINKPENFVKTIPTIQLTKATKTSQIEILKRGTNPEKIKFQIKSKSISSSPSPKKKAPIGILPAVVSSSPNASLISLSDSNPLTSPPVLAANNLAKKFSSSQESLHNYNPSQYSPTKKSFTESESPIDSGINWTCIVLNYRVSDFKENNYRLDIPLFISVEILDQKSSSTEGFSFGYWSVLHLGEVEVTESADLDMEASLLSLQEAD